MDNIKFFEENKYCIVEQALPSDLCQIFSNYTIFTEMHGYSPTTEGDVAPGTHSRYGDPLTESILLYLHKTMEENTGLRLGPTYSFFRVYRDGLSLIPHKDRPSCEISATLCLGYNYDDADGGYPICIEEKEFSQKPGDMIIYRGTELVHSRPVFNGDENAFHSQVFLHYVDMNGDNSDFLYDKRPFLGFQSA